MSSRFRNLNIGRTLRVASSNSKLRVLSSSKSMESLCDQETDSGLSTSHGNVSTESGITVKSLDLGGFVTRLMVIIINA